MNLKQFIPDFSTLSALPPEEIAVPMLQVLNYQANEEAGQNGRRSPQFHINNFCSGEASPYGDSVINQAKEVLAVAWQHLVLSGMLVPNPDSQGNWHFLSPRARQIKSVSDYVHFRKASLYPRGSIHPMIEKETYAEFLRGDYETAVFKAFKQVEIVLRRHAGAPAHIVGRDLMAKAFNEEGALTDTSEVKAERDSLMELFRGAFGRFKNPTSHREIDLTDPTEAIEILQLASMLMRTVDRRVAALRSDAA